MEKSTPCMHSLRLQVKTRVHIVLYYQAQTAKDEKCYVLLISKIGNFENIGLRLPVRGRAKYREYFIFRGDQISLIC